MKNNIVHKTVEILDGYTDLGSGATRYIVKIDGDILEFDLPADTPDGLMEIPPEVRKMAASNPYSQIVLRSIDHALCSGHPVQFPVIIPPTYIQSPLPDESS